MAESVERNARSIAEQAARNSYGPLLSMLVSRTRDIAAAEDALAEAFASALTTWPTRGVPENPDAWLLTAARNAFSNVRRHSGVVEASVVELELFAEVFAPDNTDIPDERLKLLFACAHPAIDVNIRTPLMLQCVLGLDAARIASAFVVPAATMGQRLVRAKAKIRDSGLRLDFPAQDDMPARLEQVLEAIYAAFGITWDDAHERDEAQGALTEEALFLARLLVELLPAEPEPKGLLSLMLFCHARHAARRDDQGRFVPLDQQDARLWNRSDIIEAENLLTEASRARRFGRFQCEAAIQSVHIQRPITGKLNHEALLTLYTLLLQRAPSLAAQVGYAAALLGAGRAADARQVLDDLPSEWVQSYQPYWVARSRVAIALMDLQSAKADIERAIRLSPSPAIRAYLESLSPAQ